MATDQDVMDEARRIASLSRDECLDAMEPFLDRLGFKALWPDKLEVGEWEKLSPLQQDVVRILASAPAITAGAVGWGLPRRPKELQRFAGLLAPGPLEERAAGGVQRWRIFHDALVAKIPWADAMAKAFEGLSAVDRMRALFDVGSYAYRLTQTANARVTPGELRDAQLAAGEAGIPFVIDLLERRSQNKKDPAGEAYLPVRFERMVATLDEMGATIDPAWRHAKW